MGPTKCELRENVIGNILVVQKKYIGAGVPIN